MTETFLFIRSERVRYPWWKRLGRFFHRMAGLLRSQFSNDPLDRCRWMRLPSTLRNTSDNPKDRLARAGEEEASLFLEEIGYTILHRNVRFPEGELDIVARQGPMLVFVEVKTRQGDRFGKPDVAVGSNKQHRQVATASRFLTLCRLQAVPVRFDIVSILWPKGKPPEIEHLSNAFQPRDLCR